MAVDDADGSYALGVANASFNWYRSAAIRSRRLYRASENAVILLSALIPLSAALLATSAPVSAVLGSLVVIVTGLRSVFHWQENYLRFSRAREAVEAERRRYKTSATPYSNSTTRDALLVEAITQIEQGEMGQWLKLVRPAKADDVK